MMEAVKVRRDFRNRRRTYQEVYLRMYSNGHIAFSRLAVEKMRLKKGTTLGWDDEKMGFTHTDKDNPFTVTPSNRTLCIHSEALIVYLVQWLNDDPEMDFEDALLSCPVELRLEEDEGTWIVGEPATPE